MSTVVNLFVWLLFVIATVECAATEVEAQDRKIIHKYWPYLLYYWLPWLFAIKVKIVIVTVAITLLIIKLWTPAYGYYGSYPYSVGPTGWAGEYADQPGDRDGRQLDLTTRVMRSLDLAELTYKAATENQGYECRARLTCEARHTAKNSWVVARMLDLFSSTMSEFDSGRAHDCDEVGCPLWLGGYKRRRHPPPPTNPNYDYSISSNPVNSVHSAYYSTSDEHDDRYSNNIPRGTTSR